MRKSVKAFCHWQIFIMESLLIKIFFMTYVIWPVQLLIYQKDVLKGPNFSMGKATPWDQGAWNDMMQRNQPPGDTCPTSKAYVDSYPSLWAPENFPLLVFCTTWMLVVLLLLCNGMHGHGPLRPPFGSLALSLHDIKRGILSLNLIVLREFYLNWLLFLDCCSCWVIHTWRQVVARYHTKAAYLFFHYWVIY